MGAHDSFYASLIKHQLCAAYQEIKVNLQTFSNKGWARELRSIQKEAKNRGIKFDNSLSAQIYAFRGYLESLSHR